MEAPSALESSSPQEGPNGRAVLVKRLQDSADAAIEQLMNSTNLTQTWSLPARVFPQSVVILAACLISGSEAEVRTIQLDIAIPGIGRPQSSLNALLEYCAILGRRAFETSDKGMLEIGSLASSAQRRVERIMSLVGRPDRRVFLQTELEDFRNIASNLTSTVDVIGAAFKQWSDFTDALRVALSDELGIAPAQEMSDEDLKLVQDIFDRSEQKLNKAQAQYDEQDRKLAQLLTTEVPKVCSPTEILDKLSEIIPRDSDRWPGLRRIWRGLWSGEKRTEKTFDDRLKMHMANFTEVVKVSAAEAERQKASVREQVEVVSARLKKAEADLHVARQEHAEASECLMQASRTVSQRNLKLLAESKLDLKAIQEILGTSTHQLRRLRQHISNLSTLFTDLANVIQNTIDHYQNFQRGLVMGQADIYVHIYRQYIRPGLDSMENLSRTDMDLYRSEHRQLEAWCARSTNEIEHLTLERVNKISADIESSVRLALATAISRCHFWAGE
ncbi:hypothetical protein BDW74DRAFT_187158 [Aspergillus multicolor]|uniref:uncharacterized protein n=1 Tax=Aspergillus multicolor TaxID=41759 RepID=UPI003CCCDF7D